MNPNNVRYFRIGLFILVSLITLVILVLLFHSNKLFKHKVMIETYFNESVQGLSIGSPVKYRGIKIGYVKKIDFTGSVYHLTPQSSVGRYIYVLMVIDEGFLTRLSQNKLKHVLHKAVTTGLRVKLALQDLSGNAYLEMNFVDPKQNPALPIKWTPENPTIPSMPSVFAEFADNVQNILQNLKDVDFQKLFKNMQELSSSTKTTVKHVNTILNSSQNAIIQTSHNMQTVSQNLRDLTQSLNQNPSKALFNKPPVINPRTL